MSSGLWDIVRTWLEDHEWRLVAEQPAGTGGAIEIAPSDGEAPWPVFVDVDGEAGRCLVQAILPEVPAQRRDAVALAMTRANTGLPSGHFQLDLDDGDARFVSAAEFGSPLPDADVVGRILTRVVSGNLQTTDAYVDALTEVAGGADPHDTIRAAEGS